MSSYTEQRKKKEAMHRELERAQAHLQVKVEEFDLKVARVEELEQEGHSKVQNIQILRQQEGLEAREVHLVSAGQLLSKSGESAILAQHQEETDHETASQRLGQLEISTRKTITEIKVVLKNQEQKLQQEQDAHEHEIKDCHTHLRPAPKTPRCCGRHFVRSSMLSCWRWQPSFMRNVKQGRADA